MAAKLNSMIHQTSSGSILVQPWLSSQKVSPQLAAKYVSNGWLTKLAPGVYYRPGRHPEWADAVYCLTNQLKSKVHVAGISSLQIQGISHYLSFSQEYVWLSTPDRSTIPKWFKDLPKEIGIKDWQFVKTIPRQKPGNLITETEIGSTPIRISCPELAAFELLSTVPNRTSFEYGAEIFQLLTNLSPKKVQAILEESRSVQTNRLFLFLTDFYAHPWFRRLDQSRINLGSGKRQIVKNGKFDSQYKITIPNQFVNGRQNG